MEPRVVKPPGQDLAVERLKSLYGLGGSCPAEYDFSNFDQAKCKRRSLTYPDDLNTYSSGDKVGSSLRFYSEEGKHRTSPLCSSFKHLNMNCLDDELDSFHNLKQRETEELIESEHKVSASRISKQPFKEIDKVAQPTNLTLNSRTWSECCSDTSGSLSKGVKPPTSKASNKQSLLPHHVNQIYDELFQIHQKLQQHEAEVEHLTEALKERTKESKRLRSSFDALKELNDSLKKQLNEVSEENRKMEVQAKRVQARLDNLQRKYEFMTIQRLKGNSQPAHEMKTLKQEKIPISKTYKVPLNAQVYELLAMFMDWISDHHLSQLKNEEFGLEGEKPLIKHSSQRNDIQEKCVKTSEYTAPFCFPSCYLQLLPVIAEQLQWMPFVNARHHEPFVKFIYWSLRQLDAGTQHSTLTSTLRRLGEDIFKGVVTKGIQDNSLEHSVENKPKTAAFFKSSSLPLRFLSTLIVLKTVTQADYLAQAFDSLCLDLKTDEGKTLFLDCQAVPVILGHLRISSKGLLSNVIDSLLQMTVESKSLQPFLEACSNTLFFRTCSVLLRTPKLDLHILEKLSIILQKLSKIKSNKKLFELFTIHLMLQEIQRTTHPEHAFLCINLNSTLFNLGLTKCNSLVSNASH
ncbi:coiled-coil domain-containing protein 138 isoform X3 [Elephas maximus indicus]|uniref:coiled-coil domain-containing protein 138 isoform X3 n=1 Tax=Elephas maximus indicus TaxID=99487 RepID=UPI002116A9E7|nr:coiled-coil domain-containing protein 138 isoform X3 [Elephas maximus indicus]